MLNDMVNVFKVYSENMRKTSHDVFLVFLLLNLNKLGINFNILI